MGVRRKVPDFLPRSGVPASPLGASLRSHGPPEAGLCFPPVTVSADTVSCSAARRCVASSRLCAGEATYPYAARTVFLGPDMVPPPSQWVNLLNVFFSPVAASFPSRGLDLFRTSLPGPPKLNNQHMSLYRSPTPHAQSALYASFILAIWNLFFQTMVIIIPRRPAAILVMFWGGLRRTLG